MEQNQVVESAQPKAPQSAVTLVREYFSATLAEMKALTGKDRLELASAVARERGLSYPGDINFEPVAY